MTFAKTAMRRLAPLLVLASLAPMPQLAAADEGKMPAGSWKQSCENGRVHDGILTAKCRMADGRRMASSVDMASCRSFGNRNGALYCESTKGNANWGGSYAGSCRNVSVDKHGRLSAECRKNKDHYVHTNLVAQHCPERRARNDHGRLVCESVASNSKHSQGSWQNSGHNSGQRAWQGSFQDSCRDVSTDMNGTLAATCRTVNGVWQRSSLASRQCSGQHAGNGNGQLFCEA